MLSHIVPMLKSKRPEHISKALQFCATINDIEAVKTILGQFFCTLDKQDLNDPIVIETATKLTSIFKSYYPLCASYLSLQQFKFLLKVTENNKRASYEGYTLLHAAALGCAYPELLELTIDQDTINVKSLDDTYQNTPLHLLIANEVFPNAIKLIDLAKEKRISIDFNVTDSEGKTTLILAAKMRASKMVDVILANINKEAQKQVVNRQDNDGRTALHYAVLLGDKLSVEKLIQCGASMEIKDKSGLSPNDYLLLPTSKKEQEIKSILTAVSIDLRRDEHARTNQLLDAYHNLPSPMGSEIAVNIPSRLENPAKRNADETYQSIMRLIDADLLDIRKFYDTGNINTSLMTTADKEFFLKQYHAFTGRSVLTACIEGQKDVQTYIASQNATNSQSSTNLFSNKSLDALELYQEGSKLLATDAKNAKNKFEEALKIFIARNEGLTLQCGKCYSALASCCRNLKQFDDAIDYYQKALPIYEKSASADDKRTLKMKYENCKSLMSDHSLKT